MRWSAIRLVPCLLITMAISGCSLFRAKEAEVKPVSTPSEVYAERVYEEPVSNYEPLTSQFSSTTAEPAITAVQAQASLQHHVVTKGDTLYSLARMYYGDQARWKDLLNANRAEISDPNLIRVGQRLSIP